MSDINNNTTATGTPAPADNKKKTSRGLFNQTQLRKLAKADSVGEAAGKTGNDDRLAGRDITAEIVLQLKDDVGTARSLAHSVVEHTIAGKEATIAERIAARVLEAGLKEVQKAAKQKHGRANRVKLQAYFVGKKLNGSRPNLLQTSQSIIEKAGTETLPGISALKITALTKKRNTWVAANTAQNDHQAAALNERAELKTLLKSIDERRLAIQVAADAEWPHTDPENAGTRKDFGLPANRPLPA